MNSKKADILLIFAAFVGGAGFIGMKYLLEAGYNTFQTIYGRFFVASVFMAIVFKNNLKGITKNDIKGGFITGVFLFSTAFTFTSRTAIGLISFVVLFSAVACRPITCRLPDWGVTTGVRTSDC